MLSSSASDWLSLVTRYARSLAVMSMIGHVIGLGDRHLDNILLDQGTGEVIHIDFNVCFEKGTKLPVPETVPCRLTSNFRHALGPTGVEGVFRSSCEDSLRELRSNQETLLTLLEAFVYDPLIDWAPDHRSDAERRAMDKDISQTLLAARIVELRVQWQKNRESLGSTLPVLADVLSETIAVMQECDALRRKNEALERERVLLDAAVQPEMRTVIDTLGDLCSRQASADRVTGVAADVITQSLQTSQAWQSQHVAAFDMLTTDRAPALFASVCEGSPVKQATQGVCTAMIAATNFFQTINQLALIQASVDARSQAVALLARRSKLVDQCRVILRTYASVITDSPRDAVSRNASQRWSTALESGLQARTATACDTAASEVELRAIPSAVTQACRSVESALQVMAKSLAAATVAIKEPGAREGELDSLQHELAEAETSIKSLAATSTGAATLDCAVVLLTMEALRRSSDEEATIRSDTTVEASEFKPYTGSLVQLERTLASVVHAVRLAAACRRETGASSSLSPDDTDNSLLIADTALRALRCMRELLLNFERHVLPDTMKGLQVQGGDVEPVFAAFDELCRGVPDLVKLIAGSKGAAQPVYTAQLARLRQEFATFLKVRNTVMLRMGGGL